MEKRSDIPKVEDCVSRVVLSENAPDWVVKALAKTADSAQIVRLK